MCNHPYTLTEFEPESESTVSAGDYLQGSGKLAALQMLLQHLGAAGKRTVIAAHSSLDVLDDYLSIKLGKNAFHRCAPVFPTF